MRGLIHYFREIRLDKTILWCYLIWYLVIVHFYFDPTPKLWINAAGISAVIGTGLVLSVSSGSPTEQSESKDYWQLVRLYLMPFCVSSFSSLTKERGFLLVLPPNPREILIGFTCCILFLSMVLTIKLLARSEA